MSTVQNDACSSETNEDVSGDYNLLMTRAKSYEKKLDITYSNPVNNKKKDSLRNRFFLVCKDHTIGNTWLKENDDCLNYILFEVCSSLPNGKLPSLQNVLGYFFYQRSVEPTHEERNITLDLKLHWTYCNVYTQSSTTVQKRLSDWIGK